MKRIILYSLFILSSLTISAQDITVQAEYPSVVVAGQQFTVEWTVNSGGGEFSAPSFEGFYKLMEPQTSYSSNTQIINGKMSHQTSYSYVYYLQAVKEGKFTIAPAVFTLKNKTYASDSMRIEVINNNTPRQNVEAGSDIFLNFSLNRKEVYLGEHIVATVKIYTRVNLSGINEIKYPPFTGFLKVDLETPPLTSLKQENVNGTNYGTGIIQQFLLYPQVTGEITIDPVQISVLVQQKVGQDNSFFGDFFNNYQTIPKAVISQAVKINVRQLPGIKPDDFSGVVGKLDLNATVSKDSVNVNDAVNFRVTISGNGNLKLAAVPELKLPPDVEIYDPKISDEIRNGINGSSGQKTFEYLLIPRHYGDFTIPPVSYSYFNTSKGQYERLTTDEFHFHARKGTEQNTEITVYGGVSKEDVKYVGKDIRFIKSDPGRLLKSSNILLSGRSFYTAYASALFVFLLVLFIRREHIRRNADLNAVRNRKAGKVAVKRLHEASKCLNHGQIDRFYEEILKAIWGYLSDKLNIPVSELTRNNAVNALTEKGIDEVKIKNLTDILDNCEYARFAPAASGTEAAAVYEGASEFIRSVENSIG
ncbi:MAG: BatD family protein [Bacteroidales bacterium]|nr:BatD family protein [Bacteroidales bacterium]